MTVAAVHQFVSSFVPRDAVSVHALQVRSVLLEMGFDSEIYVKETRGEMVRKARFYRSYQGPSDAWLLYQAATGSVVADYLVGRPERKLVNYHNLTPPRFFAPWEPHTAVELMVGRRQMCDLAEHTEGAIADSRFNEVDLADMGFTNTAVAPLLLDPATLDSTPDPSTLDRLGADKAAGGPDILFVGRVAPNKAQHDLVKAFSLYRRLYEPRARLRLVGAPSSPRYQRALAGFVSALDLDGAVELAGEVSDADLAAYYRSADLFVCLSEHEGFCAPLLEAMRHGVPIIGFDAGAVPETLGDAGLVLPAKDPGMVAAALDRVLNDGDLRERLVGAGRERLEDFSLTGTRQAFARVLAGLLEGAGA